MDGSLAVAFWLASLPPAEYNSPQFKIERVEKGGRLAISSGPVEFQDDIVGWEARATYVFDRFWLNRFNPTFDLSVTDQGGTYIAFGLYQQIDFSLGNLDMFLGLSFSPGLYIRGNEVDLGSPLEFRSGAEIGVKLPQDWQISFLYDHRSNADIGDINPGMETYQLKLSRPIRW